HLSGLTSLSDAVAESLGKHRGSLHLSGLTSLSDAVAESLGKHRGSLHLRSLTSLSDSAAESLACRLNLHYDIRNWPESAAETFQRYRQHTITKEIAEQFLADTDSVNLNAFTAIEDAAAESLSKHRGALDLRGLTWECLSNAAAESLCKHQGGLYLRNMMKFPRNSGRWN
ncbi:hypothetical protein, partial [Gimesia sp.]|uniref:hypothetical protein n=1 Tax=Gimesia sp. TaxID=2024833 RepID=UPI003A90129C